MTTNLHDRLSDLAEDAPTAYPPAGDLWQRGRRYGRRRAAATAGAVLLCVGLLAFACGTAWRTLDPTEPQPADSDAPTYLPDRFYEPSPWLRGTADEGPIGPLIALIPAERKTWTTTTDGYVGVSATTGEYRFLDLPDASGTPDPALSPDGRHVAYWLGGDPQRKPHTYNGQAAPTTVGYAVYDTVTGEVVSAERFATEHGLAVDTLLWADDKTVGLTFGHWLGGDADEDDTEDAQMAASSSNRHEFRVLRLGDSRSEGMPAAFDLSAYSAGGGLVITDADVDLNAEGAFGVLDTSTGAVRHYVPMPATYEVVKISPDGRRVAQHRSRNTRGVITNFRAPVVVGRLGQDRSVRMREVPGSAKPQLFVGWRDPQHVLVQRDLDPESLDHTLFSVDVQSGEVARLSAYETRPEFASGLLSSQVVRASEPPTPMDPRWKLGLSLGGLLLGIGGLAALVRRRRRG